MKVIDDFVAVAEILYIDGNDVFQYKLAVVRSKRDISGFCRPFHPPVLCALEWVADNTGRNIWCELPLGGIKDRDAGMLPLCPVSVSEISVSAQEAFPQIEA